MPPRGILGNHSCFPSLLCSTGRKGSLPFLRQRLLLWRLTLGQRWGRWHAACPDIFTNVGSPLRAHDQGAGMWGDGGVPASASPDFCLFFCDSSFLMPSWMTSLFIYMVVPSGHNPSVLTWTLTPTSSSCSVIIGFSHGGPRKPGVHPVPGVHGRAGSAWGVPGSLRAPGLLKGATAPLHEAGGR